ncbi:hypothetical protein NO995_07435 [Aestuariibaculum sp. M13]|uniref:hypothetical protein n=1 Tax=unclassified Aestuariibaculum TaxID=2646735 RepID=UPI002159D473|nr:MULTISPECIES: hypothetical protein [unclassified Aestuariibaculum]MCR8667507.1 hypothetical protein [Aestuariibaculum sp. M13]WMI65256.1 hypothetical protein RBH94_14465 [Aestuariibaculum sp. YM273]
MFNGSCISKKIEKIQNVNVLEYHNFYEYENKNVIDQIKILYSSGKEFNKIDDFQVRDLKNQNILINGDLFDLVFEKCFLKYYNDDKLYMSTLKETSQLYYIGKLDQSTFFYTQFFLLKITDKKKTFLIEKLIMLNSNYNSLTALINLSDNRCFDEGCESRISRRISTNKFIIEFSPYSADLINESPWSTEEVFYTYFNFTKDGYLNIKMRD